MLPVHTILHPTDFSEHSRYAFRLACALARDYGARLVVLHVVPAGTTELIALLQVGTQKRTGTIRETFWDELLRVQATDPAVHVEHRLEDGEPAAEILRLAEEIRADLIVMGTHGRTGLSRLLMGSVAEQVVRKAPCPVLTVRPPHPDTPQKKAVASDFSDNTEREANVPDKQGAPPRGGTVREIAPSGTPVSCAGLPADSQVVRRCGRFTLIRGAQGFHWVLKSRGGSVWYWHADAKQWVVGCPAYRTEREASAGLDEILAHEKAGNLDERHAAPRSRRNLNRESFMKV